MDEVTTGSTPSLASHRRRTLLKGPVIWLVFGAFLLGIVAHATLTAIQLHGVPVTVADHWERVERYRALVRDPKNYEYDPHSGLYSVEIIFDPSPSLAALVAAGELEYVNLVLPTVPREASINRYWMTWAQARDGVMEAMGNGEFSGFDVQGKPPLHLELWFRKSVRPEVQQLIVDLESLAASLRTEAAEVSDEN